MLTLQRFSGINNLVPPERQRPDSRKQSTALAEALNVDVGNDGELMRRAGFEHASQVCHKNVWEGDGFTLATTAGGDLVSIVGNIATILSPSLGVARVWYSNWADGRTAYSNGSIMGIVNAGGAAATPWGVPIPGSVGTASAIAGDLFAGTYRWAVTYQRLSDGLEGGPEYSGELQLADNSGIELAALPQLDGYRMRIYLTSHNGEVARLAGTTLTDSFTFAGANTDLVLECQTDFVAPAPVGTLSGQWRGRTLVADGEILWASLHARPEHFHLDKDFKLMRGAITMVQPVSSGIFVGTTKELCFLRGDRWDQLSYTRMIDKPVVLGSGVTVPGQYLKRADAAAGEGDCMLCICDGLVTAGYQDGGSAQLTQDVYRTDATEVAATFRLLDGVPAIPQYIAIPQ